MALALASTCWHAAHLREPTAAISRSEKRQGRSAHLCGNAVAVDQVLVDDEVGAVEVLHLLEHLLLGQLGVERRNRAPARDRQEADGQLGAVREQHGAAPALAQAELPDAELFRDELAEHPVRQRPLVRGPWVRAAGADGGPVRGGEQVEQVLERLRPCLGPRLTLGELAVQARDRRARLVGGPVRARVLAPQLLAELHRGVHLGRLHILIVRWVVRGSRAPLAPFEPCLAPDWDKIVCR